jgi:hypothetical protein
VRALPHMTTMMPTDASAKFVCVLLARILLHRGSSARQLKMWIKWSTVSGDARRSNSLKKTCRVGR